MSEGSEERSVVGPGRSQPVSERGGRSFRIVRTVGRDGRPARS